MPEAVSINNDPSLRLATLIIASGQTTTQPLALSMPLAGSFDNKPFTMRLVDAPGTTGTLTLMAGHNPEALAEVTKDGSAIEITPGEVLDPITTWGLPYVAIKASEAQAAERTIHVIVAQL